LLTATLGAGAAGFLTSSPLESSHPADMPGWELFLYPRPRPCYRSPTGFAIVPGSRTTVPGPDPTDPRPRTMVHDPDPEPRPIRPRPKAWDPGPRPDSRQSMHH
jgi:hypothetical protein